LFQLLLLFSRQDFAHLGSHVGIQFVNLFQLIVCQTQLLSRKRREHRRRAAAPGATTSRTTGATSVWSRSTRAACAFLSRPILSATTWSWPARSCSTGTARTLTARLFPTTAVTRSTITRAAFGTELVFAQLAVAVLIEFFQRFAGRLNLIGRQLAVTVPIKCGEHRWRRRCIAARSARPTAARGLRCGHRQSGQDNPGTQQATDRASHQMSP
jgi:hypothetical protein